MKRGFQQEVKQHQSLKKLIGSDMTIKKIFSDMVDLKDNMVMLQERLDEQNTKLLLFEKNTSKQSTDFEKQNKIIQLRFEKLSKENKETSLKVCDLEKLIQYLEATLGNLKTQGDHQEKTQNEDEDDPTSSVQQLRQLQNKEFYQQMPLTATRGFSESTKNYTYKMDRQMSSLEAQKVIMRDSYHRPHGQKPKTSYAMKNRMNSISALTLESDAPLVGMARAIKLDRSTLLNMKLLNKQQQKKGNLTQNYGYGQRPNYRTSKHSPSLEPYTSHPKTKDPNTNSSHHFGYSTKQLNFISGDRQKQLHSRFASLQNINSIIIGEAGVGKGREPLEGNVGLNGATIQQANLVHFEKLGDECFEC